MTIHDLFAPKPKPTPAPPTDRAAPAAAAEDTNYGTSSIAAMAHQMASCPEGGRDTLLNTLCMKAGRLVRDGKLTRDTAESYLRDAAMSVSDASFTSAQIDEKLNRVITEGQHSSYEVTPREWERPGAPGAPGAPPAAPAARTIDDSSADADSEAAPRERTSWWPKDIGPIVRGEADPEPPPSLLHRADGVPLFYSGKLNGLIGESESGKTWVALLGVAQELQAGHRVTYIDCEDSASGIIGRIRMLGVTDSQLSRLAYVGPDDAFGYDAGQDLFEHLAEHQPTLIVLDGYNAAMTMMGLNLLDNMDIYRFALRLLRPLKNTGAAVVFVDHVTKSKENRGSYAIGGQAKRADVDGCALNVEVVTPFGKGMAGKLRLTVSKDRAGHVRGASSGAKNAGTVALESTADGTAISISIEAPEMREPGSTFRPTVLMQRVSHFLATTQGAVSQNALLAGVQGNDKHKKDAVELLVAEGYVTRTAGARSALLYSHSRPYFAELDAMAEDADPFDA